MQPESINQETILAKCRNSILASDPSAKIILYGSRARGDATAESDYDLLIIVKNEDIIQKEEFFRKLLFPIEIETGAVLTIFVVDEKSWDSPLYLAMPFFKNVRQDGIAL